MSGSLSGPRHISRPRTGKIRSAVGFHRRRASNRVLPAPSRSSEARCCSGFIGVRRKWRGVPGPSSNFDFGRRFPPFLGPMPCARF
ncbi:uncharacterized protein STAUR_4938 [Stigmatella aurantiaca DW4/3-1]|nr:uncharacterized protein STAUR_4938 [Stigmatella aurantiaca DW4/3-1]